MIKNDKEIRYRVAGKVVLRRIGKDQLLVPVSGPVARQNCVFPLNRTAKFVWDRVSVGKPVDEIATEMAGAFAVSPEAAREDCGYCVATLVEQQLLEEDRS